MEDKNFKERIVEHWAKHRTKYLIVVGFVATLGVGYLIGKKSVSVSITIEDNESIKNLIVAPRAGEVSFVQNLTDHAIGNDNENVIMAPEARELFITNSMTKGHPGKILEDAATGVKYMSQGEAAKELGLGIYKIRKMIESGELIDHGPNTGLKIA